MTLSRRQFLGATGSGVLASVLFPGLARAAAAPRARPGATLDDIEHIVILMQENRSFDEYFGTMSGVIGFSDPNAIPGVFRQAGGQDANGPNTDGYTLPWHMDTRTTDAQSTGELDHSWGPQHAMWNQGLMDNFLAPQGEQRITMGYFEQADIPYHWALADAFTICDRYHCSVLGPTDPNRVMSMSGSIGDPTNGGPIIENTVNTQNPMQWDPIPVQLQAAGVDWYVYQESDNYGDNMLPYFSAFQDTSTDLYRRGNSTIKSTSLLGQGIADALRSQVLDRTLPEVAWIIGPAETTEHPDYTPGRGAQFIDQILEALTADLDVWAKTLLIINHDENDGHFDHVLPPTAPAGQTDENVAGQPIGLGFRVPCLLVSPFTRGPLVCSDVFDHTSVIQLLELRFGVRCPNISSWRRETVGNLVQAINFAAPPSTRMPTLPDANQLAAAAAKQSSLPAPEPPSPQVMPTQQTSPRRGRPSGPVEYSRAQSETVQRQTV
jgi:phospholipase C